MMKRGDIVPLADGRTTILLEQIEKDDGEVYETWEALSGTEKIDIFYWDEESRWAVDMTSTLAESAGQDPAQARRLVRKSLSKIDFDALNAALKLPKSSP